MSTHEYNRSSSCKPICPTLNYELPIDPTLNQIIKLIKNFVPHEPTSECSFRQFTDGLTNRLFKIAYDAGTSKVQVLIRIYGEKTELLIDREKELRSMLALHKKGLAPPVYGKFLNGVCYGYIAGKPFSALDIVDPTKSTLVAQHLARFHATEVPDIPTSPSLFDTLSKWQKQVPESGDIHRVVNIKDGDYTDDFFCKEVAWLKNKMKSFREWKVAFCHNDLLAGNIIFKEDKVDFIDYEYGSYNYVLFDIGNHMCEAMGVDVNLSLFPTEHFIKRWLRNYYAASNEIDPVNMDNTYVNLKYEQLQLMILAANLYWGVWALVQSSFSNVDFDYLLYSKKRFRTFHALKSKFNLE